MVLSFLSCLDIRTIGGIGASAITSSSREWGRLSIANTDALHSMGSGEGDLPSGIIS